MGLGFKDGHSDAEYKLSQSPTTICNSSSQLVSRKAPRLYNIYPQLLVYIHLCMHTDIHIYVNLEKYVYTYLRGSVCFMLYLNPEMA